MSRRKSVIFGLNSFKIFLTCRKLLLNFSNVEFMSSAALGKLIRLHQRMVQVGGKLVMCCIAKDIHTVFVLTKLDKMLKIVKDEQTGLNSF